MAQNSTMRAELEKTECKTVTWELKNWKQDHALLTTSQASCVVELGKAKVTLRLFLRPIENSFHIPDISEGTYLPRSGLKASVYKRGRGLGRSQSVSTNSLYYSTMQPETYDSYTAVMKWYALFAEILSGHQKVALSVNASEASNYATGTGYINCNKSNGSVVPVVEELIFLGGWRRNLDGTRQVVSNASVCPSEDLNISLTVTLSRFTETGDEVDAGIELNPVEEQTQAETSLLNQFKIMFMTEDNFADLKLETKDGMTLNAHKFQLAARSPYFRNLIDDAVKNNDFDGTLKLENVNGKPLMAILHWLYSGELNECSANVMEDVVDAAIKLELSCLLKDLDKKLISICNEENMFRLYQVAKKNTMTTAMEDISVYIRQTV